MKKTSGLLIAMVLALAACGGGGGVAASVNGTDISVSDVESLIHLEEGTITKEQFAQFLGFRIQFEVIKQSILEEYDISVTDEEILAEADAIFDEANQAAETAGQPTQTREEFTTSRGVTEAFLYEVARQGLLDEKVSQVLVEDAEPPTQAAIDTAMGAAIMSGTEVCVSHILLGELSTLTGEELETAKAEAEEAALDVLARLEAGEDFAEIAMAESTDTGSGANGGVLGCTSPSGYVPAFAEATMTAPIGEVLATPVETIYGYHVMLVTERTDPTPESLPTEEELVESLTAQDVDGLFQAWILEQLGAAEVTVEERFGTWQTDPTPQVVPPTQ